jgi:calcium-dependent protein kinase
MLDVHSLYILEQELRNGQFETTYRCMERATGLRYACRSVSKQRLLRPADVEGVRREVTVLQHLRAQPNIAEFRAAFEDADSVHLVMELCSGGELLDRVAARGSYSERQAAAACRDVLTVVHVCHSMGVMHRDIRPENFLLASSAEDAPLKAVHFGLSIFIEPGQQFSTMPQTFASYAK